jgi:predicted secreted protein
MVLASPIGVMQAGAQETGSISGTVTGGSPATAVVGACVNAYQAMGMGGNSTQTASDGSYTISGLAPGSYNVSVDPGCGGSVSSPYASQNLPNPVTVTSGGNQGGTDFLLVLGGSISGTVTGGSPATAVAGACVNANPTTGMGGYGTQTDASGNYTIANLAPGSYNVSVDPTCGGSVSSLYAPQSLPNPVTVTPGGNQGGTNFLLVLGGSISGTVTDSGTRAGVGGVCVSAFSSMGGNGTQTDSNGNYTITGLPAGTYSVQADPTCGDSQQTRYVQKTIYNVSVTAGVVTSNVNASLRVMQLLATTVAVTPSANPIRFGNAVTYTATLSSSDGSSDGGGTMAFFDGSAPISSCQSQPMVGVVATCAVPGSKVGSHSITATYSGDINYATSTSPVFTETVNKALTSTSVTSSKNPVTVGKSVSYRVTVTGSDGGGAVAFFDGTTPISSCQIEVLTSGVATCTITASRVGTHSITATYSGDARYAKSTSPAFSESVVYATSTLVTSSKNPVTVGKSVSYRATVTGSNGGGTVAFFDGTTPISSCQTKVLTSGVATCTVTAAAVGTHLIKATYSGDARYAKSTSPAFSESVVAA